MRVAYALAGVALAWGSAALADCKVTQLGELPVQMQGLRPIVRAEINGRPAPFTLDSGAFYSSISPGGARDYGLALYPAPQGLTVYGIGGVVDTQATKVRQFGLFGTTLKGIEFLVGGSEIGTGIGLLGQNILSIGDVEYDLPGGAVRLFKSSGCARTGLAYWTKGGGFFSVDLKPMDPIGRHTVATVYVNDKPVEATFDTGAPQTILSLRAAARAGVHPGDPGVEQVGVVSGLGRKVSTAWIARFRTIRIGDEQLANAKLIIGDTGITDMLIGADYFVSHRLFVSNATHRIDFTYNGGQVFSTATRTEGAIAKAATATSETRAETAEALARRGAMALVQHDTNAALADLNAAVAAAPGEARYLSQRAEVYAARGDLKAAGADIDAALKLDPADGQARLVRAALRLRDGDRAGALADVDQAATSIGQANEGMLAVGGLYTELDAFDRAIAAYSSWIAAHPADSSRPAAFNGRCWARALAGRELEAALSDCNAAIRGRPREANFLDSRALVEYRLGRADRALADANAAIATNPKLPWSLWVRALIEDKAGDRAKAAADRAAATSVYPGIAKAADTRGVR